MQHAFSFIILSKNQQKMEKLVQFANNLQKFSYTGYCETGALQYGVIMTLHLGTLIFILNKLTKEYSWVDRIWSILPIVYSAYFLYFQASCDFFQITLRQWIMFGCVTAWGLRLTYNFYRKGGFKKGGEDYRWEYIRKNYHWFLVELLNFFFISYYQLVLIFMFSAPIYFASNLYFNIFDIGLTALWLLLFVGQVIADEQQWEFQTKKYQLLNENENKLQNIPSPYNVGFIKEGLWKYCRHPNFFCEISMWWVMFGFSLSSQGFNYSFLGALLLNLLFMGSTALTELITSKKYPGYREYKKQTSMLIPFLPLKKKEKAK